MAFTVIRKIPVVIPNGTIMGRKGKVTLSEPTKKVGSNQAVPLRVSWSSFPPATVGRMVLLVASSPVMEIPVNGLAQGRFDGELNSGSRKDLQAADLQLFSNQGMPKEQIELMPDFSPPKT